MLVVDASAIVEGLLTRPSRPELADRLASDELAAPGVMHLEVHQALRGLVRSRGIREARAEEARQDYLALPLETFPHEPLVDRVWELRGAFTAYDAAYVALSEVLGVPLVTSDRRLARAKGHRAEIELY